MCRDDSSANVLVARCRKPPNSASNAVTKVCTSRMIPAPSTLVITADTMVKPTLISRSGPRAGASSSRRNRPSSSVLRCSGASRKSRADRAGGVSTTIRSQRPSASAMACSWPSFSIAMYSWVPEKDDERAS